ncbi:hypothetical protein GCM10010967_42460 [Dyadobacter beijingensis]|uniref:DUF2851 family protein n=1 Tax=Dyadobacter beijingensis TaxID=365489 RepID=A0ABQ2IBA6_9BACT|nr:DUF2851 family protein [Dyadobacter beijingensis]GGN03237.1 hypothetical protein GCM10010967_42460 [Dyadobacter beijingensis]
MNEDLLAFIWRFQYFEQKALRTDENMPLSVIRPGFRNTNAGPDFAEARIVIDGVVWVGSIEIHVRSSDWYLHEHERNGAYDGVVLHVVWDNDGPAHRRDGTAVPTLSLNGLVQASIIERYRLLQDEKEMVPCSSQFATVDQIRKYAMLDRVLLERLARKAADIHQLLETNQQDWEQTAYQWLGRHFGFKLNDPPFQRLTAIVPWKIIRKHTDRLMQVEALLFGCAGLIGEESEDIYVRQLQQEFRFLSAKYQLADAIMQPHEWKYARLRPAGFPTVRLAQFARLLCNTGGFLNRFLTAGHFDEIRELFRIEQSAYWREHYLFGKKARGLVPYLGADASNLLIINAAVPLLVAYSKQREHPALLDKAIYWLSEIPAENNRITREWASLGMRVKSAADSQALIEWFNNYCTPKRCLECTVGAALVRET